MIALADRLGADTLVTGHYARIADDGDGPLLAPAADPAKDQSYMLSGCRPARSARLRFPLGDLTKPGARDRRRGRPARSPAGPRARTSASSPARASASSCAATAACAIARGDPRPPRPADRAPPRTPPLHRRAAARHRCRGWEPLYVLATDATANTVTVGTRAEMETRRVALRDAVLHRAGARVDAVKLRYRSRPVAATLPGEPGAGSHPSLDLDLAEEVAAGAPGQLAALLSDGRVVGSGTIAAQAASASSFSSRA